MPKVFSYKFDSGPFNSEEELLTDWQIGNCRRAVQWYIYQQKNIFLRPEQVLCPGGYYHTGNFVSKVGETFSFNQLLNGDIIYAEKIRNKTGENIDHRRSAFASTDDYLTALHTALYTGQEIWHASLIDGSSAYWPVDKFLHFYRPVAAKRI